MADVELSTMLPANLCLETFLHHRLLDTSYPIAERWRALFSLRNLTGDGPRKALVAGMSEYYIRLFAFVVVAFLMREKWEMMLNGGWWWWTVVGLCSDERQVQSAGARSCVRARADAGCGRHPCAASHSPGHPLLPSDSAPWGNPLILVLWLLASSWVWRPALCQPLVTDADSQWQAIGDVLCSKLANCWREGGVNGIKQQYNSVADDVIMEIFWRFSKRLLSFWLSFSSGDSALGGNTLNICKLGFRPWPGTSGSELKIKHVLPLLQSRPAQWQRCIMFWSTPLSVVGESCVMKDDGVTEGFWMQAAEALGAIGGVECVELLKESLVSDPAPEVRETCELALHRLQQGQACDDAQSPFRSVDPAAPASSCSSTADLRWLSPQYHRLLHSSLF